MATELANEMVEYRAKHSLSLKELAQKAKVTYPTAVKAEKGEEVTRYTEAKIRLAIKD